MKMTKHQDLKNEVRRSCKLRNAKVVPVIAGPTGLMTKNLREILNIGAVPWVLIWSWLDKIIMQPLEGMDDPRNI